MTSDKPPYYRRYQKEIAEQAHALQTCTTEQYVLILKFYDENVFIIKGMEGVDILRSIIPCTEEINYIEEQDLHFIRVLEWPFHKIMCLKCANLNPCNWKYFNELDEEQFEYRIDTFSIFRPTPVLQSDCPDSVGHGTG